MVASPRRFRWRTQTAGREARLRRKGAGAEKEVLSPRMKRCWPLASGRRMLEILLHGISTRNYRKVLLRWRDGGGEQSNVSREFIEASEQTLKELWSDGSRVKTC